MNISMKIIRQGTFETNSSSTHAICIKEETPTDFPEEVYFGLGEFGWENARYDSVSDRACYLHTAINNFTYEDKTKYKDIKDKITNILLKHGIKSRWKEETKADEWSYIDHYYELASFINKILEDENLLLEYLFNKDTFIQTGNDNDENETYWKIEEEYSQKEGWYFYEKTN